MIVTSPVTYLAKWKATPRVPFVPRDCECGCRIDSRKWRDPPPP